MIEIQEIVTPCRDAGGENFGIHTQLTFDLVPLVSKVVSVIGLTFRGRTSAIAAFQAVDLLMQTAPAKPSGFAFMSTDPSLAPPTPQKHPYDRGKLDDTLFPITYIQLNLFPESPRDGYACASRFANESVGPTAVAGLIDQVLQAPFA